MPFLMPPEWAPQTATWLSWPTNADTWPQNLELAQREFVQLVHAIAVDQPVRVLCGGDGIRAVAENEILALHRSVLTWRQTAHIELVEIRTNDAWARDYAPTFVKSIADQQGLNEHNDENGGLHSIDWHYNAWGGKYPPYDQDQLVAARVADHLGIKNHPAGICAEGGALEINGNRVLLVTRSSILNRNRNPEIDQRVVEGVLKTLLGAEQIVWLPGEQLGATIIGDDTDGHIDQLARFTDDHTILYAWTDDEDNPQRAGLAANRDVLERQMLAIDPSVRLIPLPLPPAIEHCDLRIPASYCNFLITNHSVLVPQFESPESDARAIEILTPLFPDRRLVPLPSKNLTVGLGSFHCLTQQQPA